MPEKLAVNLIPKEETKRRSWEKFLKWVLTYGRYIIIGTEIIVLSGFLLRFKFDRDLKTLSDQVKTKKTMIESFGELEGQTRALQSHLTAVKRLQGQSSSPSGVLTSLAALTPYDVFFSQLRVSPPKVKISATAISLDGFAYFIAGLKRAKEFKDISLDTVREEPSGIEFTVQATYLGSQND